MRAIVFSGGPGMESGAVGAATAPVRQPVDLVQTMSSLVLLLALAAASFAQGAFFGSAQLFILALLAVAVVLALASGTLPAADLRGRFVLAGALLAGWALVRASAAGTPTSGLSWALFGAGTAAVVSLSRRLSGTSRAILAGGLLAAGVAVALTGWLGVALQLQPWGLPSQGLWRAASTLTYSNATAGLLVPLALVAVARLTATPRSVYLSLAAMCLLTTIGATLSRAGLAALGLGLLVLCWLLGARRVARVAAGPAVGAGVALLGLLPSLSAGAPARPAYAAAAMAAGLMLVVLVQRSAGWMLALPAAGVALAAALVVLFLAPQVQQAVSALTHARLTLASSARSGEATAALRIIAGHPLAGAGPGHAILRWTSAGGAVNVDQYAHDEYLQVFTDLGIAGAALAGLLLAEAGRLLWRARAASPDRALWAGAVAAAAAFALHSGFDFLWQVPVIPLILAAIAGLAISAPPAQRHELLGTPFQEMRG
jgi:O-antigen ligase